MTLRICAYSAGLLLGLVCLLTTCKPNQQDAVLPGVSRIEVVATTSQRSYFIEDTLNNQVMLDVTYYQGADPITAPAGMKPAYLVNGSPIVGNTCRFAQSGTYTITAKVGTLESSNQLGPFVVGTAKELIGKFVLKTTVPFVNADSGSRLPLTYEVYDKQGRQLYYQQQYKLWANNNLYAGSNQTFSTRQPGQYRLQGDLFGVRSVVLSVTARAAVTYPVVRLPVVIHVPKNMESEQLDPTAVLALVNDTYRNRRVRFADPNQADSFIEFYPAPLAPDGKLLPTPGLDQLNFESPADGATTLDSVTKIVRAWCPQQYINVFVNLSWNRSYVFTTSYAFRPALKEWLPTNLDCDDLRAAYWATNVPAVYIYYGGIFGSYTFEVQNHSVLAHELGHFLGLYHTFDFGCTSVNSFYTVFDTPVHEQSRPDAGGSKYTCDRLPFRSLNIMDYFTPELILTADQVEVMRNTVRYGDYIPYPGRVSLPGGRRGVGLPATLPAGQLVACPAP